MKDQAPDWEQAPRAGADPAFAFGSSEHVDRKGRVDEHRGGKARAISAEEHDRTRDVRNRIDTDRRFQRQQQPARRLDPRAQLDDSREAKREDGKDGESRQQDIRGEPAREGSERRRQKGRGSDTHRTKGDRLLRIVRREKDRDEPLDSALRQMRSRHGSRVVT